MVSGLGLTSCNTTKYLKDGEQLLTGNKIKFINAKHVPNKRSLKYQLSTLYKQKENSSIFFIPREWIYYKSSDPNDTTKFDSWKKRVLAEEPAIYKQEETEATVNSMNFYMKYRGFYNANVYADPLVSKNGKKISLTYYVEPKELFTIDTVHFSSPDRRIHHILQEISEETTLQKGKGLDREFYEDEKDRILKYLRNHGYAQFYPNYFSPLEADTTEKKQKAVLYFNINTPFQDTVHQVFRIGSITIYPQYNPNNSLSELQDTTIQGYRFLTPEVEKKFQLKRQVILDAIFLKPGAIYSQEDYDKTNRQLSGLGVFKFVRINQEVDSLQPDRLNFRIELPRSPRMQLGLDFEVNYTNRSSTSGSGNLIGISLNPSLRNRNMFRGAELLVSNLSAGVEVNPNVRGLEFWNTIDLGAQVDLYFPRFKDYLGIWKGLNKIPVNRIRKQEGKGLYPLLKEKAATRMTLSYNYLQLFEFYRYNLLNASYGYDLQKDNYHRYIINHFSIEYLEPTTEPRFEEILQENAFLRESFGQQLFVSLLFKEFSYLHNSPINRFGENSYFGLSLEMAGAEIWASNVLYNSIAKNPSTFKLGSIDFSQYIKAEFDVRYTKQLTDKRSYATRLNFGIARPFGFTSDVPYVKQFYVGGPNSIRAWAARGLGPGGYVDPLTQDNTNRLLFYQAGDLKLEFNLEYRFNIFWLMDGALFLDGGNIWTIRSDTTRCGSQFLFKEKAIEGCSDNFVNPPFYKQIALGGGAGVRFDFTYFILRFDAGVKLRNPAILEGNDGYWTNFNNPDLKFGDVVNFNLGLGYPF